MVMLGRACLLLAVALLSWIPSIGQPKASHVISGEFDTAKPVRVVAVAAADTSTWLDLHRQTFTNSYTFKIPAYPGIVIYFRSGSREKRIYIPHTLDEKSHFHWVDVQFSRRSHYLIYQVNRTREMERVVID